VWQPAHPSSPAIVPRSREVGASVKSSHPVLDRRLPNRALGWKPSEWESGSWHSGRALSPETAPARQLAAGELEGGG
jgi:hypothetical protein